MLRPRGPIEEQVTTTASAPPSRANCTMARTRRMVVLVRLCVANGVPDQAFVHHVKLLDIRQFLLRELREQRNQHVAGMKVGKCMDM